VQLTNLESGTQMNLAKAMRIQSPELSNLAWASNAIFPPMIALKLDSRFDSLPPMARD
jgi:hypothetical protein